jgi:hypothetical protein
VQVCLAEVARKEFVAVGGGEVFLDRVHEPRAEAAPLKPGVYDEPADMARAVDQPSSHRAHYLVSPPRGKDLVGIVLAEEASQRLSQRWDGVVLIEFGFGLVAEILEFKDPLGVASTCRPDDGSDNGY